MKQTQTWLAVVVVGLGLVVIEQVAQIFAALKSGKSETEGT